MSFVPVSASNGQVLPDDIEKAIQPNTCLVTVMLANNETGVIMPVAEIARSVCEWDNINLPSQLVFLITFDNIYFLIQKWQENKAAEWKSC